MRIFSMLILAGILMSPMAILNYMVMPELQNLKTVYENADQIADKAVENDYR